MFFIKKIKIIYSYDTKNWVRHKIFHTGIPNAYVEHILLYYWLYLMKFIF